MRFAGFFTDSVTPSDVLGMGPRRDWCRAGGVRLVGFFTDSVTPSDVMNGPRRDWCRAGSVRLAGFFTDSVTPSDVMEELLKGFIKMSKGSGRFIVFSGSP